MEKVYHLFYARLGVDINSDVYKNVKDPSIEVLKVVRNEERIIVDISGGERKNLTVEQLLSLFSRASGNGVVSDRTMLH